MRRPLMFVCDDPGRGGCAAIAHGLWRSYETAAEKLLVTDLAGMGARFSPAERAGAGNRRVIDFPIDEARTGFTRYGARAAWELLRAHAPAAIVFHDSRALESTLALKRAAIAARIPFIAVQHLAPPDFAPSADLPPRFLAWPAKAEAVIFVSDENAARFAAAAPVAPRHTQTIPNGVAASDGVRPDPAARAHLRALLDAEEADALLLLVGRLDPLKGQEDAIAALNALNAHTGRRARLALVGAGDPAYRAKLEKLARAAGVADQTRFLGWRHDARRLMRGADMVLQLARAEGSPLALLEAAAEGAPIIALPSGGVGEAIEGAAIMLDPAPQGLSQRLAASIRALSEDAQSAARLGAAAQARWRERFAEERMHERHAEVLRELEAARAPPRLRAAPVCLTPPQRLDLRDPRRAWSIAEGAWETGQVGLVAQHGARLVLRFAADAPRTLQIILHLRASATQPGRVVAVICEKRRLARWIFWDTRLHERRLRLERAPDQRELRLEFHMLFPGVPPRAAGARALLEITEVRIEPILSD